MKVSAMYPGTFDPITLGHEDLVRRATVLFDRVVVAIADMPGAKAPMFTTDERVAMAANALADIERVEVTGYAGLTVDFARENGLRVIIRGLRAVSDLSRLALFAVIRRSLPEDDHSKRFATAFARLIVPAIREQFLPKMPGFTIATIEIPQRRATGLDGAFEHGLNGSHEFFVAQQRDSSCSTSRMNAGQEQGFTRVDVPHTNDNARVHDELLDRNTAPAGPGPKIICGKVIAERFWSEVAKQPMLSHVIGPVK
jgi:pantetheine-phosphate adenylyltransferase